MYMSKLYSISEARSKLPQLVRDAERGHPVRLSRRGKPVAVMLSADDYQRLCERAALEPDFVESIEMFRARHELSDLHIEEVFADVRDRSTGREVEL